MVYPFSFHRLVLGGTLFGTERWNTSLAIYGPDQTAVSDELLEDIAGVVSTWYSGVGGTAPLIGNQAKLTEIKLNRINPAGHYQDPDSKTWIYPTPINGGSSVIGAPQLATVVTLRTAFERGRACRGRMYLPPTAGFIEPASDGRATAASALSKANSVATLINNINAQYATTGGGGDFHGRVVIVSDVGTGAWHEVTGVAAGRVIDTMRSRRSSLDEDYQEATTAITP